MIKNKYPDCIRINKNSKVTVKENGKQAIFLNPERSEYCVIHMDGCVVNNKLSSDYVVSKSAVGDIVIELKGMDVDHAVEQVFATASLLTENKFREGKIAGLVICSRKPSFDTKSQKYQSKFLKDFKAPLHIWPKNDEFVFERVLDFKGPK